MSEVNESQANAGSERRKHPRIKKNYIVRFCEKSNPSLKFEVSQVENISQGGMCFSSMIPFDLGVEMVVELRTPYLSDTVMLEGKVLESQERIKGMIYANRMEFNNVDAKALEVLKKVEQYNGQRPE